MGKALFPAGFVISEEYLTFEDMKEHEKEWDVQSTQTGPGLFHSTLQAIHTPSMQLASHVYSKSMLLTGAYPVGCVVLYALEGAATVTIHDEVVHSNDLLVGLPLETIDVVMSGSSTAYTIVIEEQLFFSTFFKYFGVTYEEYAETKKLVIEPNQLGSFFEGITAWIKYLSNSELKMTFEQRYEAVELEILHFIYGYVEVEEKIQKREKFDIVRVRKYLEQHIRTPLSVTKMSQELDISERQLHNAFKANYGITPKGYLQKIRLNAIHHELVEANSETVVISKIAFKYGFTHMSHFINEYKKLFGKRPSSTKDCRK